MMLNRNAFRDGWPGATMTSENDLDGLKRTLSSLYGALPGTSRDTPKAISGISILYPDRRLLEGRALKQ